MTRLQNKFYILIALFFLVLTFQNCSPSGLSSLLTNDPILKASGGNGEPYDGKPEYTRLVPGLSCDNNKIAIGTLDIHGDSATVITNENSCRNSSEEIPKSRLEFSTYWSQFVGFDGGVYTYLQNRQENINKGIFTEAWCRVMNSDHSQSLYEFAVEWQDENSTASLSVISDQDPSHLEIPNDQKMTSVRAIEMDRISYSVLKEDINLTIFFKQSLPGKKVPGTFFRYVNNKPTQMNVECLMGGQFDPVAPKLNFSGNINKTLLLGQQMETLAPIVNKSTVTFSLDGVLPYGLQFSEKTGAITGRAQALAPRQKYTISARFPFGKISQQVSLAVGQTQIVDLSNSANPSAPCTDANQNCNLSGAVALANQMAPFPLVVLIRTPQLDLTGTALSVSGDLSLMGQLSERTVIDAKLASRHFTVAEKGFLEINHLRLINGHADQGGSIYARYGNLLIRDSDFQNNSADSGEANGIQYGYGGAIFSAWGDLEIIHSEFFNNRSAENGRGGGGAIYAASDQTVIVRDSKFENNYGQYGGAINIDSRSGANIFEISNCEFKTNKSFNGGAISSMSANLAISNSHFIRNESIFDGGAIYFLMTARDTISNSVFDGNIGAGIGSPAIYWGGLDWGGFMGMYSVLYVLDSKFINHSSRTPGSGVILNMGGDVAMANSDLRGNSSLRACKNLLPPPNTRFLSLGPNLSDDQSCP